MSGDMPDLKGLIGKVAGGATLTRAEAEQAFDVMMSGNATPAQMGGFLMALRVRGETVDEIAGAATVMRSKMTTIKGRTGDIAICGPGGDGTGSYNISTARQFGVAACGLPSDQPGNRPASSQTHHLYALARHGVPRERDHPQPSTTGG